MPLELIDARRIADEEHFSSSGCVGRVSLWSIDNEVRNTELNLNRIAICGWHLTRTECSDSRITTAQDLWIQKSLCLLVV